MTYASATQFHIYLAAFNQEKALVGAFYVITNLRMDLFQALVYVSKVCSCSDNNKVPPVIIYSSLIRPESETHKVTYLLNSGSGTSRGVSRWKD